MRSLLPSAAVLVRAVISLVAAAMFARWSQENFFQYMMQHFAIDRLVDYQTCATIPWFKFNVSQGNILAEIAIHEYVGQFIYWVTGRA